MKPWDEVSYFQDTDTLLQGQQNKGRSDREERSWKNRSQKRDQKSDQRPDPRIRAEEPGPLRDTTSEGPSTLYKENVVTTSEVVNKEV
jgi:hypothetical protein